MGRKRKNRRNAAAGSGAGAAERQPASGGPSSGASGESPLRAPESPGRAPESPGRAPGASARVGDTGRGKRGGGGSEASRLWWYAAIVVIAAVAAFAQTFSYQYTLDDIGIVEENPAIRSLDIGRILRTNYWGEGDDKHDQGLYRPFTIATYAVQYALHGLDPEPYHVVNVLLHAVASLLLFLVMWELSRSGGQALWAGVLFAVHPIHSEAVAGIVGRAEMLSLMGVLGCLFLYLRGLREEIASDSARWAWLGGACVAALIGMLSKEVAVIAVAVVLVTEVFVPRCRRLIAGNRAAVAAVAGIVGATLLFLWLRSGAVVARSVHVGFQELSDGERMATALRICMEYVGMLLFPVQLVADYPTLDVPISRGLFEPGVLGALGVLAVLVALVIWSWERAVVVGWGVLFFLGALFPVSNLPFAIGVMKAERLLYSPSAGFVAALVALGFYWLDRPATRYGLRAAFALLAVAYLTRTVMRNPVWRDNRRLADATLAVMPNSVIFNTVRFNLLRDAGQNAEARPYIERAFKAQPDNFTTLFNFGNVELDLGNLESAVSFYRRALAIRDSHSGALNNLGRALGELGRQREAAEAYEQLRSVNPDHPGSYVNLMGVYAGLGDIEKGLPLAEEAVRRFPNLAAAHWNAAAMYRAAGQERRAEAALARARQLDASISTTRDVRE